MGMTMPTPTLIQAIAAIRSGRRDEAYRMLIEIIDHDPNNVLAWLWMVDVCNTEDEQRECLKQILTIDPNHAAARQKLDQLEKLPRPTTSAQSTFQPVSVPTASRDYQKPITEPTEKPKPEENILSHVDAVQNRGLSWAAIVVGAICAEVVNFIIGFILGYLVGSGQITLQTYASLIAFTSAAGYLAGGLVAGAIARRRRGTHGFITGLLGIAFGLGLGAVMQLVLTPASLLSLALLPITGWIGGKLTGS